MEELKDKERTQEQINEEIFKKYTQQVPKDKKKEKKKWIKTFTITLVSILLIMGTILFITYNIEEKSKKKEIETSTQPENVQKENIMQGEKNEEEEKANKNPYTTISDNFYGMRFNKTIAEFCKTYNSILDSTISDTELYKLKEEDFKFKGIQSETNLRTYDADKTIYGITLYLESDSNYIVYAAFGWYNNESITSNSNFKMYITKLCVPMVIALTNPNDTTYISELIDEHYKGNILYRVEEKSVGYSFCHLIAISEQRYKEIFDNNTTDSKDNVSNNTSSTTQESGETSSSSSNNSSNSNNSSSNGNKNNNDSSTTKQNSSESTKRPETNASSEEKPIVKKITMPQLVGLTISQAESKLKELGLYYKIETTNSLSKDSVTSQSIPAGTNRAEDEYSTIVIKGYKKIEANVSVHVKTGANSSKYELVGKELEVKLNNDSVRDSYYNGDGYTAQFFGITTPKITVKVYIKDKLMNTKEFNIEKLVEKSDRGFIEVEIEI